MALTAQDKEWISAKIETSDTKAELISDKAAEKAVEKVLRIMADSMENHAKNCGARQGWTRIRNVLIASALAAILAAAASVLLASMAGCQDASVTEFFREQPRVSAPSGAARPEDAKEVDWRPAREVKRETRHTRGLDWFGPSPGETIAQVKPMRVPAEGGADFEGMEPFDIRRVGPTILIWAGIAISLGGIALAIFLPVFRKIGIWVAVGGGALIVSGIAFEAYPWLAALIVLAAVGAGAVWLIVHFRNRAREKETLNTVVKAVENAGEAAAAVKQKIKEAAKAGGKKAVVDKVVAGAKGA
jgi:hypothetical protein